MEILCSSQKNGLVLHHHVTSDLACGHHRMTQVVCAFLSFLNIRFISIQVLCLFDFWSQGRIGTVFCEISLIFSFRIFAPMPITPMPITPMPITPMPIAPMPITPMPITHFPSAYLRFFVDRLSLELSMLVIFLFSFIFVLLLILHEAFPVHMEFWQTNWHQSTSLLLFSPFGIIPQMHLTRILHLALPLFNPCHLPCC